ncbi:MAG: hypothetical protein IPM69_19760 [Ignavibacteria bacterium]|nr:hypothetical protein [Ignavibacteria bacterium]
MRNYLLQLALCCGILVCMSGCIYIVPEFFIWQDKHFKTSEIDYKNEHYQSAMKGYRAMTEIYPASIFSDRMLLHIGDCYFKVQSYDSSILYLTTLLRRPPTKRERKNSYDNTRHDAREILSQAYYQKGMYAASLYYLSFSDTVYPFRSWCGNAYEGRSNTARYLDLYHKVGDNEKELKYLLRTISCSCHDKQDKLIRIKELLRGKKNLTSELDSALVRMESGEGLEGYTWYRFRFLNSSICIYEIDECNKVVIKNKAEAASAVRTSDFYATIKSLE